MVLHRGRKNGHLERTVGNEFRYSTFDIRHSPRYIRSSWPLCDGRNTAAGRMDIWSEPSGMNFDIRHSIFDIHPVTSALRGRGAMVLHRGRKNGHSDQWPVVDGERPPDIRRENHAPRTTNHSPTSITADSDPPGSDRRSTDQPNWRCCRNSTWSCLRAFR